VAVDHKVYDHEIQARLDERLRSLTVRAGGWERADPYVLHYLVAHAEQAIDHLDQPATAAVAELLDDPGFVTRADPFAWPARRSASEAGSTVPPPASSSAAYTSSHPSTCPSASRCSTSPPSRRACLPIPEAAPARSPWAAQWTAWRPSAVRMVFTGHTGQVRAMAFSPDGTTLATIARPVSRMSRTRSRAPAGKARLSSPIHGNRGESQPHTARGRFAPFKSFVRLGATR
jgi:hypothetical protein